ncbi:MAG TPA: carbamoyltransferase C-terminal domain-containing protein [Thermoanaerobaculia bacterium]|nr:carbamoyltransferase C-terminal domain-containing protein [Thermoanaerobaculia bacterium]
MRILGLNAYHGDSSAALLEDGRFVSGVEEERLNRVKHWAGFPGLAVRQVMDDAAAGLDEVDAVAVSRDPSAHLLEKVLFAFRRRPSLEAVRSRLSNQVNVLGLEERLSGLDRGRFRGKSHRVEHHLAHLASSFFCAPFEEAACLTVDGFGDFLSSMSAVGRGNRLVPIDQVAFPHSLGIFYTAMTQFLGFPKYGDEYKVMGLAAYEEPGFLGQVREGGGLRTDGTFETSPEYFRHATKGVTMSWDDGEPTIGPLWGERLREILGPEREARDELTDRHRDLASSLQAMYEEAFFHRLRWLQGKTGLNALCLAGSCAMNSVANGKIFRETDFREVYIQSAAGDAGTALGSGLYVWHQVLGKPRDFVMEHSYWGPGYSDERVQSAVREAIPGLEEDPGPAGVSVGDFNVERHEEEQLLCHETAKAIASGEIVGWYQGRGEWGPRALGNRSIVVDPRRADMKDVLNARIKRREAFRPFAPSILEESTAEYFEESYPDPFMIKVYPIRPEKRAMIPAVTHVDGTGRLQTVSKRQNPRYWALIKAFEERTGVPVLLNTSFNENEPIVNTPEEALACFFRTKMHRLVMGNWVVARR